MRQIAKLLTGALILVGCAHKGLIQERTDEFVGQPLSAVTAKLGSPAEEREALGGKVYIWSTGVGAETSQGKCMIRAIMRGDLIGSFDWEGTESQCAYSALMLKGSDCRKGLADVRLWLPTCL